MVQTLNVEIEGNSLVHSLPWLPSPMPLSDSPARAPWGVRCSRWKAGAARGHPSAAPWLRLYLYVVSESGRSPWTVAGPPCILERTSRAEEPWAGRRPGYSATAPPGEPCRMEWMRTCRENERPKWSMILFCKPKESSVIWRPKLSKTAHRERRMERQTYLP